MNKKISISIVLALVAINVFVFWKIFEFKTKQSPDSIADKDASAQKMSQVSDKKTENIPVAEVIESIDPDIKEIESQLGSIDEKDFGDENLSDQNLGL